MVAIVPTPGPSSVSTWALVALRENGSSATVRTAYRTAKAGRLDELVIAGSPVVLLTTNAI